MTCDAVPLSEHVSPTCEHSPIPRPRRARRATPIFKSQRVSLATANRAARATPPHPAFHNPTRDPEQIFHTHQQISTNTYFQPYVLDYYVGSAGWRGIGFDVDERLSEDVSCLVQSYGALIVPAIGFNA